MRVAFVTYYYYSLKYNPSTFNFRRGKKNDNFSKLCNCAPVLQGQGNKQQKKVLKEAAPKTTQSFCMYLFLFSAPSSLCISMCSVKGCWLISPQSNATSPQANTNGAKTKKKTWENVAIAFCVNVTSSRTGCMRAYAHTRAPRVAAGVLLFSRHLFPSLSAPLAFLFFLASLSCSPRMQ